MRENKRSFSKKSKSVTHRRVLKVLSSCSAILLVMIIGVVYIPQVSFAALSTQKMILDKTATNIQTEFEVQNIKVQDTEVQDTEVQDTEVQDTEVQDTDLRNNVIRNKKLDQIPQLDIDEPILIEEDDNTAVEECVEGTDLSNDPDYIASLKKIYDNEQLEMLKAPRKWVTMPNVVGMTEANALSALKDIGIVGRVIYVDNGAEEGYCFKQDITAGQQWNTDASIFIWIQKSKEMSEPPIEEEEIISKIEKNSNYTGQADSINNPSEILESTDLNISQDEIIDSQIQKSKEMSKPPIEEEEIISKIEKNSSYTGQTDSINNPSEILESTGLNIRQDERIDSQQVNN